MKNTRVATEGPGFAGIAEYLHESATMRLRTDMIALQPQAIYDKNTVTLQDTAKRVVQTSG